MANDLKNQTNLLCFFFFSILFFIRAEATLCRIQHQISSVLGYWRGYGKVFSSVNRHPDPELLTSSSLHGFMSTKGSKLMNQQKAATFVLPPAQVNHNQNKTSVDCRRERCVQAWVRSASLVSWSWNASAQPSDQDPSEAATLHPPIYSQTLSRYEMESNSATGRRAHQ